MHSTLSCGVSSLMCDETTTPLVIWTSPGLTNASVTVQLRHAVHGLGSVVRSNPSTANPFVRFPIAERLFKSSWVVRGWSAQSELRLVSLESTDEEVNAYMSLWHRRPYGTGRRPASAEKNYDFSVCRTGPKIPRIRHRCLKSREFCQCLYENTRLLKLVVGCF